MWNLGRGGNVMLTDAQIIKAINENTVWINDMFVAAISYKTLMEITTGHFYKYPYD